jgi:hypothetical protein
MTPHPEIPDFYVYTRDTLPALDSASSWEYDGSKWVKVSGSKYGAPLTKAEYAQRYCKVQDEKVVADITKMPMLPL